MFLLSTKELAPAGAPGGRAQEFSMTGATGNGEAPQALQYSPHACLASVTVLCSPLQALGVRCFYGASVMSRRQPHVSLPACSANPV